MHAESNDNRQVRPLKAPFPWFGGKSRAASLIWERFGRVDNYVEPFAGSLAVLLGNPHPPKVETVNDKDALLANFWRAVKWAPDAVAEHCDWPVNEADLHARHRWLVERIPDVTAGMDDPEWFDARVAGWWVWGISAWLGRGWCRPSADDVLTRSKPRMGSGKGNRGNGIHATYAVSAAEWAISLCSRLRHVRVLCGEWDRVLTNSVIRADKGITGLVLDPPYDFEEYTDKRVYAENHDVSGDVGAWCRKNGDLPHLRIALCGYQGGHDLPGWTEQTWEAQGGYGNQAQGRGRENAKRETIWFSPHCLEAKQLGLFAG